MSVELTNDGIKIFLEQFAISSPTRTRVNKFCVGKDQTTPLVTDSDLDSKVEFDTTTGNYKSFESGFPSIDATAYFPAKSDVKNLLASIMSRLNITIMTKIAIMMDLL